MVYPPRRHPVRQGRLSFGFKTVFFYPFSSVISKLKVSLYTFS